MPRSSIQRKRVCHWRRQSPFAVNCIVGFRRRRFDISYRSWRYRLGAKIENIVEFKRPDLNRKVQLETVQCWKIAGYFCDLASRDCVFHFRSCVPCCHFICAGVVTSLVNEVFDLHRVMVGLKPVPSDDGWVSHGYWKTESLYSLVSTIING